MPPRGRRDQRGASALELSIVAPVFLLVIFVVIQGALYLYGRNVALSAAREGASDARLVQPHEYTAAVDIALRRKVTTYATEVGNDTLLAPQVDIGYDATGGRVSVTVTGQAISLVPGLTLDVQRQAAGEIEQFEADLGG